MNKQFNGNIYFFIIRLLPPPIVNKEDFEISLITYIKKYLTEFAKDEIIKFDEPINIELNLSCNFYPYVESIERLGMEFLQNSEITQGDTFFILNFDWEQVLLSKLESIMSQDNENNHIVFLDYNKHDKTAINTLNDNLALIKNYFINYDPEKRKTSFHYHKVQ